jgi:hypothetical protein
VSFGDVYIAGSYVLFINQLYPQFDDVDLVIYTDTPAKELLNFLIKSFDGEFEIGKSWIQGTDGGVENSEYKGFVSVAYLKNEECYINLLIKSQSWHANAPMQHKPIHTDFCTKLHGIPVMPIGTILRAKQEYGRVKDHMQLAAVSRFVADPSILVHKVDHMPSGIRPAHDYRKSDLVKAKSKSASSLIDQLTNS